IRDAVMLGVAAVQPVVSARSEMPRAALVRGRRADRWQRIAVSAVKQCGRAVVPPVAEPRTVDALLDVLRAPAADPALLPVEPGAAGNARALSALDLGAVSRATLVVGPEGGWTPDEVARLSDVCSPVTLGGRTLRADAVPLVALAALFTIWREF